ncbi:MAG: periplasmic heavy metal sensor [Pseudomonadales bacterium]
MSVNLSKAQLWLIGALVFSVALNLFLVGYVLGQDPAWRRSPPMGPPHSQLRRFMHSQSEARRQALAPLVRTYWHTSHESMLQLRAARHSLNAALQSDPLDETAVEQAMTGVDEALRNSSRQSQRAMLPLLRALTPEERAQLAASGRRMRPHERREPHGAGPS